MGILLSFSIANVLGNCLLTYNAILLICNENDYWLGNPLLITISLSLTNLVLLILAVHLRLKSRWERKARNFIGLNIISWVISVTVVCMDVVSILHSSRVVFAAIILISVLFISVKCLIIMKHQKKKRCLLETYGKTFLRGNICASKTAELYSEGLKTSR